jgi:hypothetical protein
LSNNNHINDSPGYRADDGQHEYLVNICDHVNEALCSPSEGFVCMYNTTAHTLEGILATNKVLGQSPYWEEMSHEGQLDGVRLTANNGYYGSIPAKVTIEFKCDPSAIVPPKTLSVSPQYDFGMCVLCMSVISYICES